MSSDQHHKGLNEFARTSAKTAAQRGGPDRLAKLSKRLNVIADAEIAKLASPPIACKPGCCHCCCGVIRATLPELLDITSLVRTWTPEDRANLKERCDAYVRSSKDYWNYDSEQIKEPCPFLVDDLCSVYPQRPLACRAASSKDAAACEKIRFGIPTPIHSRPGQESICRSLIEGCVEGLADAQCASGTYDLGAAMKALLSEPNPETRVTRREDDLLKRCKLESETGAPERASEWERPFRTPEFQALIQSLPAKTKIDKAANLANQLDVANLFRVFLPPCFTSDDDFADWLAVYEQNLDRSIDTKVDPRLAFEALYFGALETFYLPYCGMDVKPLRQKIMGHAHSQIAVPAFPELAEPFGRPRKPGKFRLGYISLNLSASNGSRWALGWLAGHSPEIETFAFHLGIAEDSVTFRWRRLSDHYYHLPYTAPTIAGMVRSLDLDALIFTDIGSETITTQLSLLRLARRQIAAWGIPVTSGSPAIDYYLSSADMEPENAQDHYTEQLIRLPGSGLAYPRARSRPSDKTLAELGLPPDGYYLIAQNAIKLLPKRDAIYREISERTGKPIVICRPIPAYVGNTVLNRMNRAGVHVVGLPKVSVEDYLRVIQLADCVLDSFDFGGGITTVDTLALRKPLVSCPGAFMKSRLAIPFMKQSGVEPLLTPSEREYIGLACNPDRIATIMATQNPDPMFQDQTPIRALDNFLLNLRD